MNFDQLPDIEHELQEAQAKLNLLEGQLSTSDPDIGRAQMTIDGLWALFSEARKNVGNVKPDEFASRFEFMHAEMDTLVKRVEQPQ